ncbi:MAG: hypothetical protein KME43_23945 [Myxacorys chilensis ATA2-1-KO14]|jgi:hypothetical protein|nr:hypothetical protein [Myxacorys chilensis ATA2-1-KO14]
MTDAYSDYRDQGQQDDYFDTDLSTAHRQAGISDRQKIETESLEDQSLEFSEPSLPDALHLPSSQPLTPVQSTPTSEDTPKPESSTAPD